MPQGLSFSDFRAVFFDVDGTLVDTLPTLVRGLGDSYERYNGTRPSDEEIIGTIGMPLRAQMRMFTDKRVTDGELMERVNYTIGRYQIHAHLEREFAPAVETLRFARAKGLKTALITSKNSTEVSLAQKRFTWMASVDTIICSSDVTHPKPDPESALLACQRLGVQPNEAVFIGDAVFDLRCAREAGTVAVGVSYGSGKKEALLQEKPALMFDTPDDLLAWARSVDRIPCLERN